jgi:hypothetical protein
MMTIHIPGLDPDEKRRQEQWHETAVPEAELVYQLFDKGLIHIVRELRGVSGATIDVKSDAKAIAKAVDEWAGVFDRQKTIFNEIADRTPIPAKELIEHELSALVATVPVALRATGILPVNFDEIEAPLLPIGVEYDALVDVSSYFRPALLQELRNDLAALGGEVEKLLKLKQGALSGDKNTIRMGGRYIQFMATHLSEWPELKGSIAHEEAVKLALSHTFAHEYGHHIWTAFDTRTEGEHMFLSRIRDVVAMPFSFEGLGRQEKEVLLELFSQSIANAYLERAYEKESRSLQYLPAILAVLNRRNDARVAQFTRLARLMESKKWHPRHIEEALSKARFTMREAGFTAQTRKLVLPWSDIGYHLPVMELEKLDWVVNGKRV